MSSYAQVKENWAKRGFSCDIWVDSPGRVWSNFVHDADELVMLFEGEIEISFSGRTLHPKVGEEILIPKGETHTVINIGATTNRWYYGYQQK